MEGGGGNADREPLGWRKKKFGGEAVSDRGIYRILAWKRSTGVGGKFSNLFYLASDRQGEKIPRRDCTKDGGRKF